MKLKGIILDVDGTIADTEEIHRQAFNQAFKQHGLGWHWSVDDYHKILSISGGKERFKKCLRQDRALRKRIKEPVRFIKELYQHKSEIYRSMLSAGNIRLRPGINRLINEAIDKNILLGIASCSSAANLRTLIKQTLDTEPEELFTAIITNDIVSDKKPSPIVYQCALSSMGLTSNNCIAIEDTANGNLAAINAGLKTIITTHKYTVDNKFDGASLIVNHLGEADRRMIVNHGNNFNHSYIDLALLEKILNYNDSNENIYDDFSKAASNLN